MKIRLRSNMDFGGPFQDGVLELETEEITLRSLLLDLSRRIGVSFIEEGNGEVNPLDYAISVNGCDCSMLPERLNTRLSADSELKIEVIMSGGG